MNNNFGIESTNPRNRRAFAHAKISQYKNGEASYDEAFESAYKASATRKGEASGFGRALGGVVVDSYAQLHDKDEVVVYGLSPAKHREVAANVAAGRPIGYFSDANMLRPDAENTPVMKGVIQDPIAEGYRPSSPKG